MLPLKGDAIRFAHSEEFAEDRRRVAFHLNMKPISLLCLALLTTPLKGDPEKLSALDAQLLLEKIKELREGSNKLVGARYTTAHSAFRSAIQSDSAAHALYLNCVEKVQFEDQQKSGSDFRDWKRRHNDRTDTPAFRRALRHQLNWLLLTLQAASEPTGSDKIWARALDQIDTIFKDAEDLEGSQQLLRQNVLNTVFAEAYSVDNIDLTDWPTSPLQLEAVYEGLVLPALRSVKTLAELDQAWEKRIVHEGALIQAWDKPKKGLARPEYSAAMEKFLQVRRPDLQWQKEMDFFGVGDQKAASLRMLKHLETHAAHRDCAKWIGEFQAAVKGQIAPPAPDPGRAAGTAEDGDTPAGPEPGEGGSR
ncbi:MAG: hypothetical protein CMO40_02455 [Verrucomicrobiaceae bacterium]|mgnify:FL=1|nr:hypothetical protein [Verrucomicrobiaceae bacterium]